MYCASAGDSRLPSHPGVLQIPGTLELAGDQPVALLQNVAAEFPNRASIESLEFGEGPPQPQTVEENQELAQLAPGVEQLQRVGENERHAEADSREDDGAETVVPKGAQLWSPSATHIAAKL